MLLCQSKVRYIGEEAGSERIPQPQYTLISTQVTSGTFIKFLARRSMRHNILSTLIIIQKLF
jgi:hypothetical protein